jgi:hypothetical protein
MRNWIERVINHFKTNRALAIDMTSSSTGNADGEQKFYFNPVNPTASSMYHKATGRFGVKTAEQHRMVPIQRLDSLLAKA